MTAIARELDEKLRTLDAQSASSLEKVVRHALDLVNARQRDSDRLPEDFFRKIAQEFGNGPFERPSQGEPEKREDW